MPRIEAGAAATGSDEDEDLRSNSSTASVVSSSSSLHQLQQQPTQLAPGTDKKSARSRKKKRDDLCDACKTKSAVWFCPADDAYLCHSCDQSVHSANAFSLRHERVSLQVEAEPVMISSASKKDKHSSDSSQQIARSKRLRRNISSSSPICNNKSMIKTCEEETTSQESGENQVQQQGEGSHCNVRDEEGGGGGGEEEQEEELAHTVPVFVGEPDPGLAKRRAGEEEQQHSPASGIATDLGDADEDADDADIDRFLNSEHIFSEDDENHHHQRPAAAPRQEEREKPRDEDEDQGLGLIVAPSSATCEDLNGLLGLRRNSLDELVDDDDDERFDFAIRKNNAMLRKSNPAGAEFPALTDGQDAEAGSAFCPGKVKLEEHHYNVEEEFLKPCREGILGEILGLKSYERNIHRMHVQHLQQRICLRLDYDDVLNAWSDRRPFLTDSSSAAAAATGGINLLQVPEDSTSDAAGSSDVGVVPDLSRRNARPCAVEQAGRVPVVALELLDAATPGTAAMAANVGSGGGGREARVSRYREKRRTRLFSKKIRYEVRKLNAERRPRLKGRFVKRSPVG